MKQGADYLFLYTVNLDTRARYDPCILSTLREIDE